MPNPTPPAPDLTTDLTADLTKLAAEACDLWQAQLEACAQDPQVRAELLKMAEPSQRLFAGWAAMMQSGLHGTPPPPDTVHPAAPGASAAGAASPSAAAGAAAAAAAHDGGALRLAQLAHRLGELEKRVAELEGSLTTGRHG